MSLTRSDIQLPITNNQRRHVFFFVNSKAESESQEVQSNIFLNCEDTDVIVHTLHPYMSAHAMNEHINETYVMLMHILCKQVKCN